MKSLVHFPKVQTTNYFLTTVKLRQKTFHDLKVQITEYFVYYFRVQSKKYIVHYSGIIQFLFIFISNICIKN